MGVEIQLFEVGVHAYVDSLQNEFPLFLEEVPLAKRMCIVFQHIRAVW
jgi:hypothetical protein